MSKTFKEEVDSYYTKKYNQLESTTLKIIKKYNRTLEPANVISSAYIYIIDKEKEITHFSRVFSKSIEHIIYSFTLQYINKTLLWPNSKLNDEANKFINRTLNIDDQESESIECQNLITYKHNIYNEEFISEFHRSLNKLDYICFQSFYYEGIDNAKDFALKFDISISSSYITINRLKKLLKNHIKKHKIE